MRKILILAISITFLAAPVMAEKTIHLKDGSVLNGKVLSMNNGVYKIKTENIGVVEIKESKVQMISDGSAPKPAASNVMSGMSNGLAVQAQQMQQMMLSDPNLLKGIEGLANNPNIMQIIQDPTILQDLMSMDPVAIENNPAIQQLMNDPQMKAFINQVQQKTTP